MSFIKQKKNLPCYSKSLILVVLMYFSCKSQSMIFMFIMVYTQNYIQKALKVLKYDILYSTTP